MLPGDKGATQSRLVEACLFNGKVTGGAIKINNHGALLVKVSVVGHALVGVPVMQ
jgi:hypothetical protein